MTMTNKLPMMNTNSNMNMRMNNAMPMNNMYRLLLMPMLKSGLSMRLANSPTEMARLVSPGFFSPNLFLSEMKQFHQALFLHIV